MKKFFYLISACAVVLMAGCSKEDIETSTPEYELVVNMDKSSFGDDTRAPRSAWEDGDEVAVVFHGDVDSSQGVKYLKLTYSLASDSWTSEWIGTTAAAVAAKETKECRATYHSLGIGTATYDSSGDLRFPSPYVGVGADDPMQNLGGCVLLCNDGTYSVNDNVITLDITMTPACAQYTIRNISAADGKIWKLYIIKNNSGNKWQAFTGTTVSSAFVANTTSHTTNHVMYGHQCTDGVAFYGKHITGLMNYGDYTFTLTDGSNTYTRTFTVNSGFSEGAAIIMNGPTANNLNGWTTVTQ